MDLPFTRIERAIGRIVAPRMGWWLYLSIALLAGVAYFALPMLKVILYKVVIATLMGFIGDKIARAMEASNPRPHVLLAEYDRIAAEEATTWGEGGTGSRPPTYNNERMRELARRVDAIYYRRALVIAAAMIAGALGT